MSTPSMACFDRPHRWRAAWAVVFAVTGVADAAELTVLLHDADGQRTAAAVRLYDERGVLQVPDQAIDLGGLGYLYAPGALIHYADWTSTRVRSQYPFFGSSWFRSQHPKDAACFFAEGEFRVELPPGRYRLDVRKGLEFVPVARDVALAAAARTEPVKLSRWVDMAARGWYSGDGHVHAERTSRAVTETILRWARAEDVRLVNVLLMGDARQTYYAQPALGPAGHLEAGGTWLIPGQEEPRSRHLGHTLHLAPPALLRDAAHYYAYRDIFDRNHGRGLSGFAHVGRRRWSLGAERGLTLLAPAGLVDFAEIAQMGYIGVNLWYEFLNLGFRLTAMAGSDVPWGGTIGGTRVYAFTGNQFSADRWVAAVRAGRTFVTNGPMLEFTVNENLPGSVLKLRRGQRVQINARARGRVPGARPVRLELVSLGEVVKSTEGDGDLAIETTLEADHSFWITAVAVTNREPLMDQPGFFSGAVATPVYVEVEGMPARHERQIAVLVSRRMRCLQETERWLDAGDAVGEPGGPGGWESAAALRDSTPQLRRQIAEARRYYGRMLPAPSP